MASVPHAQVKPSVAYALNDRQVDIETPEHVSVGYELADLGSRFTAMLIDGIVLSVAGLVLLLGMLALGVMGAMTGAGMAGGGVVVAVMVAVWFLLSWGYRVYYEGFRDGQTPGKKAMRIRVVQDGGFPVTFRAAAVRNLVRMVDMQPGMSWGVAALSMMLHPRTKRLGDIAAGTVVVRDRTGQPIPEDRAPDVPAAVGRPALSDQEFGALSMYVQRRATLEFAVRTQLAGTLTNRLAPRVGMDPRGLQMTADQFLGMVYEEENVRRRAAGAGGRAGSGQATGLFRRQKPMWDTYNRMLEEARGGLPKMGEARVSRFAAMYREVAADLARARTYGGSPELLFTLERAVGAGHNLLYRAPRSRWIGLRRWVMGGFPALVRLRWRPIAVASVLLYLPAILTFAAVRRDPGLGRSMLGPAMMERAEQAETRQAQGKAYISAEDDGGSSVLSSLLMTNNIQVSFAAFAGGITAGAGTALMLIYNGIIVGAVTGVFANYEANVFLWSFLLVHGVIELTAICIAGGAGLWLGSAFLLPGRLTRREALVRRGRESVSLIGGVAVMLVLAGILEGFISPSGLPAEVKLAFAALLAVGLAVYLGLAGRDEYARRAAEAAAER